MKFKNGFTIIELLVVIMIIGLLASIIAISVNGSRVKARDARRKADIRQIRIALELYKAEKGYYPVITDWATSETTVYDNGAARWTSLKAALASYINLPGDPMPQGTSGPWADNNYHFAYRASGDGLVYDLLCQLEDKNSKDACKNACWKYHNGEIGIAPGTPWCAPCPSGAAFSNYIFADH